MLHIYIVILIALQNVDLSKSADIVQYSVLKVTQEISSEKLQTMLGERHQITKSKGPLLFEIKTNMADRSPITLGKLLQEIENHLENSSPPLAVEFLRSTRFCPAVANSFIHPATIGHEAQGCSIRCEGDDTVGAYWNEPQLQLCQDNQNIQKIANIEFTSARDVGKFLDAISSVHSISESVLPLIADKYNELASDTIETMAYSKRNQTNNALLVLDDALLKVKLNGPRALQIRHNLAFLVENIGETGHEGAIFVDWDESANPGDMIISVNSNTSNDDIFSVRPRYLLFVVYVLRR